ncbi:mannosyltransferase, partial [Chytridiales sp. JEL 0842]
YLPSTFSMYFTTIAFSTSFQPPSLKRTWKIVFLVAVSTLVGWPFSAAAALPFVLQDLFGRGLRGLGRQTPLILIDYYYYNRLMVVPLNIILYNVFSGKGKGPNIYGTEPWWFYIANSLLNFNVVFLAAAGSLPLLVIEYRALFTFPTGKALMKLLGSEKANSFEVGLV